MPAVHKSSTAIARLARSIHTLPTPLQQSILNHHSRPLAAPQPLLKSHPLLRRRHVSTTKAPQTGETQVERLVPAPNASSGPLLTRLPNRALPDISPGLSATAKLWLKTLPIFILLITLSSLSIFNYQKSSSSTVNSILYALRTSPAVRDILGDEIYFRSRVPWISGELNQLHGNIDISFWVKGNKGAARVRFVSVRRRRDGYFETLEWSLTDESGTTVHLLEIEGASDPMQGQKSKVDDMLNV